MKNNLDEDIKIVKNIINFLQLEIDSGNHKIIYNDNFYEEKTVDCIQAISNVLTQLNVNKYDINNYEERITSLKSELETYKKIAEKLASTTYDYANLEMLNICSAEYEGKVDLRKCKQFGKDINCIQCIIDWARKEVEND